MIWWAEEAAGSRSAMVVNMAAASTSLVVSVTHTWLSRLPRVRAG